MGWLEELKDRRFWRAVTAECLAMFFFIFICIGCALSTLGMVDKALGEPMFTSPPSDILSISLCFGLTIFVLAHCFGHISGAHINPAVTLALVISRQVSLLRGLFYVAAQCIGSIIASGVIMGIMGLDGDTMGGYNAASGHADVRIARALVTEWLLTFLLCFTVLATIDPSRTSGAVQGPLAIGMAVGVAHLIAVPITGCGINPARSLGPAIFANNASAREDLWIFLLAPFVGAATAAVVYPYWFAEEFFEGGLKGVFHSSSKVSSITDAGPEHLK